MKVYSDPIVFPFNETRYYRPGENTLTINGDNFKLAASERDIEVGV